MFHFLLELVLVIIAFTIFFVGWNSRKFAADDSLLFLSIAYSLVGILHISHIMACEGIGFVNISVDTSVKLWIAAQYIESLSIFIYLMILKYRKTINVNLVINIYSIITIVILLDILKYRMFFPSCFIDSKGLTGYKIVSEYLVIFILLISIYFLVKSNEVLKEKLKTNLIISLFFMIISGVCLTLYNENSVGLSNIFGHIFKLFSFIYIYKALVEETLRKPYNNLFQQYSHSQNKLIASASFLSTMIHDLKNPLANIRALSQLGKISKSNEKKREYYYKIMKNVDQLNEMLNKIMGSFCNEEFVDCNLGSLIKEVVEEIEPVCLANEIEINYQNNKEISISLEKNMFKRALYNIMKNAANAMDSGGKLDIVLKYNSKKILITIGDNGPGIPDSIRDKIFQPFVTSGGTGLGLYMVDYTIRNIHKGRVWFDTEIDKGTTFYIELPLKGEVNVKPNKFTIRKLKKAFNLFHF